MPTPDPPEEHESIDLRYELEALRLSLGLTDQPDPVRVDESGRFELRAELGRGGMGTVYEAYDTELDCSVALKVVGAISAGREKLQERLLQEARALAQIEHDNVVRVRDLRTAVSGELFIALDYVRGPTLRTWQRDRKREEIIDAYIGAARGLAEAHEVGVVHRDFKPDNVLFDTKKGRPVVVDFGLAGGVVDATRAPHGLLSPVESTGLGTPEYMAPEQHRQPADARCDQYALCVSIWEAIDEARPFASNRGPDQELPPPPSGMPWWLYRALARGLAYEARDRFPDMHALIRALDKGRRRTKYVRRGGLTASTTALGAWLILQFAIPRPCDAASEPLDAVWNDALRGEVHGALTSLDVDWSAQAADHAIETIDAAAASWSREADAICEASVGTERSATVDRKAACLDGWLERIGATVEQLRAGDEELALHLMEVLEPLVVSEDLCRLPPPVIEPDVRRLLTESELAEHLRDLDGAQDKARRAIERADLAAPCVPGSDRSFAAAAAHFRLGHVLGTRERWDEARAELRAATDHALACSDVWTTFDVRAYQAGYVIPQSGAASVLATSMLADADALLLPSAGVDSTSLRRAQLERMAGLQLIASEPPDYPRAIAAFERARARLEATPHAPLPRLIDINNNLGTAFQAVGRLREAEQAYQRATDLLADAMGPSYPSTKGAQAMVDLNRGLIALEQKDLARAGRLLSKSVANGDPLVVVRAWTGWLQVRLEAGLARNSGPLARQFVDWLRRRDALPLHLRAAGLTTAGQVLMLASISEAGEIDDPGAFEAGVSLSEAGLSLWSAHDPTQVPVASYILASCLYEAGRYTEARALLGPLLTQKSEEPFQNFVRDLDEKIERASEAKLAGADAKTPPSRAP
ncbi:serine/threonine protein kinase [Pseudenhygromyxa sp. WMMC2535]|uniref:serine/threonine-protein kinase n=1 Tax=Pseudenhygromyxa sp. WMMC2535 TaxID=2712867 RepID=UPI001553675D|nr:serine/threonine-protein kinase [Pseudenhygromyxa sp. WMMC2535]NVB40226.1 serine/threonine protein kinase [Pseudenhygromyxa sp. WMMC2535]